ncbi:hypothetical protein E2C01_005930 [Portunus trituberculatus]|uniref:Uncharacterized protein n=1 Tax=Portunus trituberculatus TaxID=210409 RepID=A0A5B7CTN4_PORTR|nr:hypothetical protein [Portunus trituberculatus]
MVFAKSTVVLVPLPRRELKYRDSSSYDHFLTSPESHCKPPHLHMESSPGKIFPTSSSLRGAPQESHSGVYHLSALEAHFLDKANLAEAGLEIPREQPSYPLRTSRARGERGSTKGVGPGCKVPEVLSTPD